MDREEAVRELGGYKVVGKIGNGTFGTVYKATIVQDEGKGEEQRYYAIKVVKISLKTTPLLHLQSSMLRRLRQKCLNQSSINPQPFSVPQVYAYQEQEYFSYMVMDLLDVTLEDFANKQMKNVFSKDCLIRICYSLMKIVEALHQLGYIHRDIKPGNFMLQMKQGQHKNVQSTVINASQKYHPTIHLIDLGLCKSYINPITKQHIPFKDHKKMVGTPIFCSLNTHQGYEQSRRDDLESVVYVIVYLVKKLPWESVGSKQGWRVEESGVESSTRKVKADMKRKLESYEQMYKIKQSTDFDILLKDQQLLPSCLLDIYKYIRKLSFQQQPNYEHLYILLQNQHITLTGKKFSQINYQCRWESLCRKQDGEKVGNVEQTIDKKKKIKINFKIPSSKLKKCINSEGVGQNLIG